MNLLAIENDGPEIVFTNYWESEHAVKGYVFLSINAGCFRLLVPAARSAFVSEMAAANEVIVSRGPWPAQNRADGLELLFEDYSDSPFCLHIGAEQVDRMPAAADRNKSFALALWTPAGKVKDLPARYRIVKRIPWLKSWRESH